MPQVSVQIANRTYELACGAGEEQRVQELAAYVDEKLGDLRRQMPPGVRITTKAFGKDRRMPITNRYEQ